MRIRTRPRGLCALDGGAAATEYAAILAVAVMTLIVVLSMYGGNLRNRAQATDSHFSDATGLGSADSQRTLTMEEDRESSP